MKKIKILMGMPITLEVLDKSCKALDLLEVFSYFKEVDKRFSTYKDDSEITLINKRQISEKDYSSQMKLIFKLAEQTKKETRGYFDIFRGNKYDPSGIVKGWAIFTAAKILKKKGFKNFYVDAGGDIQVFGKKLNRKWKVGIKNPFNQSEIIKVLEIEDKGVATSGTYIRGKHIYNPNGQLTDDIVSLTVIGPDIYEADRFATAAFAMGREGINFIENLRGFEGYMVDRKGTATYTSGFKKYEAS